MSGFVDLAIKRRENLRQGFIRVALVRPHIGHDKTMSGATIEDGEVLASIIGRRYFQLDEYDFVLAQVGNYGFGLESIDLLSEALCAKPL